MRAIRDASTLRRAGTRRAAALAAALALAGCVGADHVLHTAQGALRGARSADGSYTSYKAIPYAGDPSGHRFQRAPAPRGWSGIREAQQEPAPCASRVGAAARGGEDCLFLSVHVPGGGGGGAVLVWLPGGGFVAGSGSALLYDPVHFARRGIIVVTVNYRLGALGFLCLGTARVPGNAGLKDALAAVRWVRDNIVAFGGDPTRVTLAGDGAGAAIAEALVLSPALDRLVHRAILQSGTVLSPWAFHYDAVDRANTLAKQFTDSTDVEEVTRALLNASTKDLIAKTKNIELRYFPFAICLERELEKEERIISSPALELISTKRDRRVPILMGYNTLEAYALAPTLLRSAVAGAARGRPALLVPGELRFVSERELEQAAEQIRRAYFPSGNVTIEGLIEFYSEVHFASPIVRSAELHAAAAGAPVFLYEYGHVGARGRGSVPQVGGAEKRGAAHGDELAYLFARQEDAQQEDLHVQEKLTQLWADFIIHGQPTEATSADRWEPAAAAAAGATEAGAGEARVYAVRGRDAGMAAPRNYDRLRMLSSLYDTFYYKRVSFPN